MHKYVSATDIRYWIVYPVPNAKVNIKVKVKSKVNLDIL